MAVNLSGVTLLVMMGQSIVIPSLPLYARAFGVSDLMIGLAFSFFGAGRIIFAFPAGAMADRSGPKKAMILGLALIVSSSIMAGLATDYAILVLGRFLEGVGSTFYVTTAYTLLGQKISPQHRGFAMSINLTALLVGATIGPSIGGLSASIWGLNSPFFVYAFVTALGILWAYKTVELTPSANLNSDRGRKLLPVDEIRRLLKERSLTYVNLGALGLFMALAGVNSMAVPLYGYDNLSLTKLEMGMVLGVLALSSAICMVPVGVLSDKFGRKRVMIFSMLSSAIVSLTIPLSNSFPNFALIMALLGAAQGFSSPIHAWTADVTPPGLIGSSMGWHRLWVDLGFLSGPVIAGFVIERTRVGNVTPTVFTTLALALVIGSLAFIKTEDPVRKARIARNPT